MTAKTWAERLTPEQQESVTRELRGIGLDRRQIRSLMKHRGKVSTLELDLMRNLPPNSRGERATINSAKAAISACKKLHLVSLGGG